MKLRCSALFVAVLACGVTIIAQQPADAPQHQGGGWRQGRGGMGMGRGVGGTITAIGSDSLTVKTETGEVYTVHFSANTRFMKQPPRPAGAPAPGTGQEAGPPQEPAQGENTQPGEGRRRGMRIGTPVPIKVTDLKVGDAVMAGGEVDEAAKSVGAMMVMQVDPERAKQMREMQANFGKTWLMGRVTAINETKVTIESNVDNASHTFMADENTTLRKRRDPITLADIQPGDMVRVEGAVKDGTFVATTVSVMGGRPGGGPRQQ